MNRLTINDHISLPLAEIALLAITAQGPGGQNVNKVATAIELRFDIRASSLPTWLKEALLTSRDRRIGHNGTLVLKAQRFRSQERNRDDALQRLASLLASLASPITPRKATKPSRGARETRLAVKKVRSQVKSWRQRPVTDD